MIIMKTFTGNIEKVTSLLTKLLLFATPLFFLPITREFVLISKMYFFIYGVVILLLLSFIYMVVSRKVVWHKDVMVNGLFLFVIAAALSVVIMSPNKIQALFLPYFGFVSIVALGIYYLYLHAVSRVEKTAVLSYLSISGFIASIISIVFFVQPFRSVELPATLTFLQNPLFNTVGSQIDFLIFLGFVICAMVASFLEMRQVSKAATNHAHGKKSKTSVFFYLFFTSIIIAAILQIYQIGRTVVVDGNSLILPPFSTSWYAAIEILKNPITALFGVGLGNFAAIFTQVKPAAYNLTDLWQISSFNVSRSVFFHILTETGILGLMGLGFILTNVFKAIKSVHKSAAVLMIYMIAVFLFFPPSFMVMFLFIVALAYFAVFIPRKEEATYMADLGKVMPVYISSILLFLVFILGITYYTSVTFASEVIFKRGLDAITANNVQDLYTLQQRAIIINPYNEEFRKSFSQTNLIIANNLASKEASEITDLDRETITQAIQASIAEAKAAVTLNPQKVSNWQYLGSIYRNILNVAQGADVWTVATYQRAILLDPQNPVYRLELGGVYYLLESYDDAQRLFEQAVTLKPDWANAHYNLAWTYFRQENYEAAVRQMEQVLTLTDREESKADYEQAQKDLAEFRASLPTQEAANGDQQATDSAQTETQTAEDRLTLPEPPEASLESQIELPEEASPEAGLEDLPVPTTTQQN